MKLIIHNWNRRNKTIKEIHANCKLQTLTSLLAGMQLINKR